MCVLKIVKTSFYSAGLDIVKNKKGVSFSSDIVKKHKTAESESEFEESSSEDSDSGWEIGKTTKGTSLRNMKSRLDNKGTSRYLLKSFMLNHGCIRSIGGAHIE